MKEIYRVEGVLNRGFVGQITYMVCLEGVYNKLDIHFSFDADKRTYSPEEVTDQLIADTREVCLREYGVSRSDDELRSDILSKMKTEIHTIATLNDEFIGCVHKQLVDRHMLYDGDFASDGCIPQKQFDGVLKVTVLVFNVMKDNTHYELAVSAG
ncbi:MAG: hypothetical protein IJC56_02270 [Clostridia bacterium]|nr:hypothetical protein [Clostridia bacterium]